MSEPDFLTATRDSYDAVAEGVGELWRHELDDKPLERAMLAAFAELARAAGGPVADVGCGTGRVAARLADLGVPVFGVDISPGMVAVARRDHPGLRFEVGSMLGLDVPERSLAGLLAWYSTIHIPDELLPAAFAEFHRVLAPGGVLLTAFQVGDEPLTLTEALGRPVRLTFHRRRPERVAALLAAAGLPVRATLTRAPQHDGALPERTEQALLLAGRLAGV